MARSSKKSVALVALDAVSVEDALADMSATNEGVASAFGVTADNVDNPTTMDTNPVAGTASADAGDTNNARNHTAPENVPNLPALSNAPTEDGFRSTVQSIGRVLGKSQVAMPFLAKEVLLAASQGWLSETNKKGIVVPSLPKTRDIYATMLKSKGAARDKYRADNMLEGFPSDPEGKDSLAAQESKLHAFNRLGHRHMPDVEGRDMLDLLRRGVRIGNEVGCKLSSYALLVKIATEQLKKPSTEAALSDAELTDALTPAGKESKDEKARLEDVVKTLERIRKGNDGEKGDERPAYPSEEINRAINALNERIAAIEFEAASAEIEAKAKELLQMREAAAAKMAAFKTR